MRSALLVSALCATACGVAPTQPVTVASAAREGATPATGCERDRASIQAVQDLFATETGRTFSGPHGSTVTGDRTFAIACEGEAAPEALAIIDRRLAHLGVDTMAADDTLRGRLPTRLGSALRYLVMQGRVTFRRVDEEGMRAARAASAPSADLHWTPAEPLAHLEVDGAVTAPTLDRTYPSGNAWLLGSASDIRGGARPAFLVEPAAMDRTQIDGCASALAIQEMTGALTLTLSLTPAGAGQFAELSERSVQRRLAIVIDETVISAPVVQERIEGGSLMLTGGSGGDMYQAALYTILREAPLPDGARCSTR